MIWGSHRFGVKHIYLIRGQIGSGGVEGCYREVELLQIVQCVMLVSGVLSGAVLGSIMEDGSC